MQKGFEDGFKTQFVEKFGNSCRAAAEGAAANRKRASVVAAGFWTFEGESYRTQDGTTIPGGSTFADPWIERPWIGVKPFGHDAAEALDSQVTPDLELLGLAPFTLFEQRSPEHNPELSPTRRDADAS